MNRKATRFPLLAATLATTLAAPLAVTGCTTMTAQIREGGTLGQVDREYATTAYQLVELDHQAGRLAAGNAGDPRVPFLAQQFVAQADSLYPGLQAALQAQGVPQPQGLPPDQAAEIGRLGQLHGAAFDRQYVGDELALHERAAAVMQQEAKTTRNIALRSQVGSALPVVLSNRDKLKVLSDGLAKGR